MASNKSAIQDVKSLIGAAQLLADKAPFDSYLRAFQGKTYTSVLPFIIDVLALFGITKEAIVNKVVSAFFGSGLLAISGITEELTTTEDQSELLADLEDAVKIVLGDIIVAILSCSVDPFIPKDIMDKSGSGSQELANNRYGSISVPISLIDNYGMLNISPLNKIGKYYYNVDSANTTVNTLYKTKDMNAFIWYAMNRGVNSPQEEKNKCMWDSRRYGENRDTAAKWYEWEKSKTGDTGQFNATESLFPILQIERDTTYTDEERIRVSLARQTYVKKKDNGKEGASRLLYKFINDYLRSITIFKPKVILANFLQELSGSLPQLLSLNQSIIEEKASNVIKKALEQEDLGEDATIDDCYYSFSNDDYNTLIEENLKKRYMASSVNSTSYDSSISSTIDDLLNSTANEASLEKQISAITKTAFDISASASTTGGKVYGIELSADFDIVNYIVEALLKSLVRSIFSPQVMLLFVIVFDTIGLLDTNSLSGFDLSTITALLVNRLLAMIGSLVKIAKDIILNLLLDLFYKEIVPLLSKISAVLIMEELLLYYKLLKQALSYLPTFKLAGYNAKLDSVNYADIVPEITKPQASSNC